MLFRVLVFLGVLVLMDIYVWIAFRQYFDNSIVKIWYGLSVVICYACIFFIIINFYNRPLNAPKYLNLWVGYAFSVIVFKIVFTIIIGLEDIYRLLHYVYQFISLKFQYNSSGVSFEERRKFVGQLGLGLVSIPFFSMIYGITKGKYQYQIKKLSLSFSNLPKAFDDLRIVHISDIHAGSFDDVEEVKKGIEMIQELKPDLILFTGDLVNQDADEILPYKEMFAVLQAPLGKFSCLGNHDYGTYKNWNSTVEMKDNFEKLIQYHAEMGFQLLNNHAVELQKGNEFINIIGVENWGKPPFPQKGDLNKAIQNINTNQFNILLSHDPTHWQEIVTSQYKNITLTLSGHTHGMQFGVEIPGIKWSPSKYVYKYWAGLYREEQQFLYVNRGFGFLGFPGRVGIWPEITEITLQSKS